MTPHVQIYWFSYPLNRNQAVRSNEAMAAGIVVPYRAVAELYFWVGKQGYNDVFGFLQTICRVIRSILYKRLSLTGGLLGDF